MQAAGTRNRIEFILGNELCRPRISDPNRTLLEFLREDVRRTGAKEGCAEGDCGACTVLLGEPGDAGMEYKPVNACIMLLPTVHGKHVLTVEDLATADGDLHPLQQALVQAHGSQCGFCTPGFIMALYGFARAGGGNREELLDAIAGNLCRCTGYGPILSAATSYMDQGGTDRWTRSQADIAQRLGRLTSRESLHIETENGAYFAPVSLSELLQLREDRPDAVLLAGGTDVGPWITKQLRRLETVVYLGRVGVLQDIRSEADQLVIGAGVTYARALDTLTTEYPGLSPMFHRIGSAQIRALGTIGGNIANASPIGDMPPALIALGAGLELLSRAGPRIIALEDFFLDYGKQDLRSGEIVAAIRIPKSNRDSRFAVYKLAKRFDQDISSVCGGFQITLDGARITAARIAFGGMAATPKRARLTEERLLGGTWQSQTFEDAAEILSGEFSPITDLRATEQYRRQVVGNLLRRFFLQHETSSGAVQIRGCDEAAGG